MYLIINVLNSGNEKEAKLVKLDPIMIFIGTSHGSNV
jgi:hypothetical protein